VDKVLALETLKKSWKKLGLYRHALALLNWDMHTGFPEKGISERAEVTGFLGMEEFRESISEESFNAVIELKKPENFDTLSFEEKRSVLLQEREQLRMRIIPPELYERFVILTSKAQKTWESARRKSDFSLFRPELQEIIEMTRAFARLYGARFPIDEDLDASIDINEPGMKTREIRTIIQTITQPLVDLLQEITKKKKARQNQFYLPIGQSLQVELCKKAVSLIGYDFKAGKMDFSAHPFTNPIGKGDIRFTIRTKENDFTEAFFSALHEGGHALYEQNLPRDDRFFPFAAAASMGIHESQSRMWENIVGRSREFWDFFYPVFAETVGKTGIPSKEEIYFGVNSVFPSLIRTEADEVTYNLHIVLRFELEDALIKGQLEAKDLPSAWNEKMEKYLGIVPSNDSEGVLQDMHWSFGGFGYFPSYMLGNLYSAQFFHRASKQIHDLPESIRTGRFEILLDWLKENIHQKGKLYEPRQLCEIVTGEPLNPEYYLNYLKTKYTEIYLI
jgi:carboxypeptidase Taq